MGGSAEKQWLRYSHKSRPVVESQRDCCLFWKKLRMILGIKKDYELANFQSGLWKKSALQLYRTIQLIDRIGRRLNPHNLSAETSLAVSEVLRISQLECYSETTLNIERELWPWASVLTVDDILGIIWLIGMTSIENNATVITWSPSSSQLRTPIPAHDGVIKLVSLVHGLSVSYQRGGWTIYFSSPRQPHNQAKSSSSVWPVPQRWVRRPGHALVFLFGFLFCTSK